MQIYALERDKYRDYQKRNNQIRSAIRKSKLTTNMYACIEKNKNTDIIKQE